MKRQWAVVLLNLGGPDSLQSVKPFLYNLFSDREIIPLGPRPLQRPLAWLISTLRAPKTKKAYELIGGCSPILKITEKQATLLKEALQREGIVAEVFVGMRYWHPFIEETVKRIKESGFESVLGLSLYPQYSLATTGSSQRAFRRACSRYQLQCRFVSQWYDHPLYIKALAGTIRKVLKDLPLKGTCLLFSAHGLPVSFIEKGDPYKDQIEKTVELVKKELEKEGLLPELVKLSYQSRTGPMKWLEPYTDDAIRKCAFMDFKNIVIVPVSFVSDHIETLYEIDILYKGLADECGINLFRTPALNTEPTFIEALKDIVINHIG
ncbi:MAG: ferrochelatase [Nitrospirae bacterium]|nr:MAG: ferrochelatase [Nitrospirota bacterium]